MGVLQKLVKRLHNIFDKSSYHLGVLSIVYTGAGTCSILVRDYVLYSRTESGIDLSIPLDSDGYTVNNLITALNAEADYTATLIKAEYGELLSRAILEDDWRLLTDDNKLYFTTNEIWQEMQSYAYILDEQWGRIKLAEKQLYLLESTEQWLDYWGEYFFGVKRFDNEDDAAYSVRIINEIIKPDQNNVALEIILEASIGLAAVIRDAWPNRAELDPADQDKTPGYFLLDLPIPNDLSVPEAEQLIANAQDIVRRHKSSGTDFFFTILRKVIQQEESLTTTEAVIVTITASIAESFIDGAIYVDGSWRVGTPGLLVGTNDALKEQVLVQKIVVATGLPESSELIGG